MKRIIVLVILLFGLIGLRHYMFNSKKQKRAMEDYLKQSEDARAIYTGKTREVFNPIDEAYKPTTYLENYKTEKINTNHPLVLSLWVNEEDLYSEERGIIKNGFKTGRMWERAARLSIYENAKLINSYPVGIRLHGGSIRGPEYEYKSFRIYFRKSYGASELKENIIPTFNNKNKIKRFVIRRDGKHPLANKFGLDLINDLGGLAPKTRYASIYLNGKYYGLYNLFEHLSPEQLAFYYDHDDFVFAKLKGDKDLKSKILFDDFRKRAEELKLSLSEAKDISDVDSILISLMVMMFTGNTDWAQGVYIKDLKNKGPWQLISWDLDRVFFPVKKESYTGSIENPWDMKSMELGVTMKVGTIRHSFFKRVREDKEWRAYFEVLLDKLYAHFSSPKFNKRLNEYNNIARDFESIEVENSINYFLRFIKNRKREKYFNLNHEYKLE